MSQNSELKNLFHNLKEKKRVEISDIDQVGIYAFEFIELAKRQHNASREVTDYGQKVVTQIQAVENIAKPPLLSAILPAPLQKYNIDDKTFKFYLRAATSDHVLKQQSSAVYGTLLNKLRYKNWIPETDLSMLQVIKEKYQHGDSCFPFKPAQAKRLAKKLDKFIDERLISFHMYSDRKKAIAFFRRLSLERLFEFTSQFNEFASTVTEDNISYESLIEKAKRYVPADVKFDQPVISLVVAGEDDFVVKMTDAMQQSIEIAKLKDARGIKYTPESVSGLINIKEIVRKSVK